MPNLPVLALSAVWKSFGDLVAVRGASMSVGKGDIVALLGPSGCGKTTTLRMIAGFTEPDRGTIKMGDRSLVGRRPYERNVGVVFQDYALFPHMSVAKNVAYGPRRRGLARATVAERTRRYLELVRLADFGDRRPLSLSGGQQQRVALARALAIEPEVLLLDEPLSALDARLRLEIRGELRDILIAAGCATIIVTHDQEEAMSLANTIYVMNEGRIVQSGSPAEVYGRPADEFVADFVGRSNLFSGTVISQAGSLRFDGEDGVVFGWPFPGAASGPLRFAIRPERLRLRISGVTSVGVALSGTVVRRLYLGQNEEVTVALPCGRHLLAVTQAGAAPEPGASIWCCFDPTDVVLY